MNLNELVEKRSAITSQIDALLAVDMTEEARTNIANLEKEYDKLGADIETAKRQAERAKSTTAPVVERTEAKSVGVAFKEAIERAIETQQPVTFRADPYLSTTNTTLIDKSFAPVSVMKTPGKDFLTKLGVQFVSGPQLKGNYVLPAMAELIGSNPNEGIDVSTANVAPGTVVLTAKRNGASQTFTKEFLTQSGPDVLAGVLSAMIDAPYLAEAYNLMDNITVDAVDASIKIAGSTLALGDLTNLEAGVPYAKTSPHFVTTPAVAGFLKKTAGLTNQSAMWEGKIEEGNLDGYNAIGHSAANTKQLIFGDWSKAYVAVYQEPTILINPYSYAKSGKVEFVVDAIMDSGIADYRAFKWISDVSI